MRLQVTVLNPGTLGVFRFQMLQISNLNKGPKHQIDTSKLQSLGMTFGGKPLLEQTITKMLAAQ